MQITPAMPVVRPKPKRVLHILAALEGGGGVQTVLKNYYAHMDTDAVQFDFVVHGSAIGELEPWFEERGSRIYHVPTRTEKPIENTIAIARILRRGNYDAVHCHQHYKGAVAIFLAKMYGVPIRIIHSHLAYPREDILQKALRRAAMLLLNSTATHFLGCGRDAAAWLYGKTALESGKAWVLNNAIELQRFAYSEEKRRQYRRERNLTDKVVLGHVGRFVDYKNHMLLIDIFHAYQKKHENAVLLLLGDGPLKDAVRTYAEKMGLQEKVMFLGHCGDVASMLNCFDVFLLPSKFEGLAVAAVEAQANGVPVICSPYVTRELDITKGIQFVDDNAYGDLDQWCRRIEEAVSQGRYCGMPALTEAGFDIDREADKLFCLYTKGGWA